MLQRRALIVGIDSYSRRPLRGCVNDATRFRSIVEEAHFSHVVTLFDEQATKATILRELSGLVDATSANDVLFVTFSGHGAEIENPYAHNGYNETIVSVDEEHILDVEIRDILRVATSHNLCLVIDSCHSGDVTREPVPGTEATNKLASVRRWPSTATSKAAKPVGAQEQNRAQRQWDPWTAGKTCVVFSACRDRQDAVEMQFDSKVHGVLSHFLCEFLEQSPDVLNLPWRRAHEHVKRRIADSLSRDFLAKHEPQLEGLRDWKIFGNEPVLPNPFVGVATEGETTFLQAGFLHGVMPRGEWVLRPAGATTACPRGAAEDASPRWVASEIFPTISILSPCAPADVAFGRGAASGLLRAFPVSCFFKKTCIVASDDRSIVDEMCSLNELLVANHCFAFAPPELCDYRLYLTSKSISIVNKEGSVIWRHSARVKGVGLLTYTNLCKISAYDQLAEQANTMISSSCGLTGDDFFVEFVTFGPSGSQIATRMEPTVTVAEGTNLFFRIKNLSSKRACITLIGFNLNKSIEVIYPPHGGECAFLPKGCTVAIGYTETNSAIDVLTVTIPYAALLNDACEAVQMLRLVVTTEPSDFSWLEQDGLGSLESRITTPDTSRAGLGELSKEFVPKRIEKSTMSHSLTDYFVRDFRVVILPTSKGFAFQNGIMNSAAWTRRTDEPVGDYVRLRDRLLRRGQEGNFKSCFENHFRPTLKRARLGFAESSTAVVYFPGLMEDAETALGGSVDGAPLIELLSSDVDVHVVDYSSSTPLNDTCELLLPQLLELANQRKLLLVANEAGSLLPITMLASSLSLRAHVCGVALLDVPLTAKVHRAFEVLQRCFQADRCSLQELENSLCTASALCCDFITGDHGTPILLLRSGETRAQLVVSGQILDECSDDSVNRDKSNRSVLLARQLGDFTRRFAEDDPSLRAKYTPVVDSSVAGDATNMESSGEPREKRQRMSQNPTDVDVAQLFKSAAKQRSSPVDVESAAWLFAAAAEAALLERRFDSEKAEFVAFILDELLKMPANAALIDPTTVLEAISDGDELPLDAVPDQLNVNMQALHLLGEEHDLQVGLLRMIESCFRRLDKHKAAFCCLMAAAAMLDIDGETHDDAFSDILVDASQYHVHGGDYERATRLLAKLELLSPPILTIAKLEVLRGTILCHKNSFAAAVECFMRAKGIGDELLKRREAAMHHSIEPVESECSTGASGMMEGGGRQEEPRTPASDASDESSAESEIDHVIDLMCAASANLGLTFITMGLHAKALDELGESLKWSRQQNDDETVASSLRSIGLHHFALNELDKALAYLDEAVQLWPSSEMKRMCKFLRGIEAARKADESGEGASLLKIAEQMFEEALENSDDVIDKKFALAIRIWLLNVRSKLVDELDAGRHIFDTWIEAIDTSSTTGTFHLADAHHMYARFLCDQGANEAAKEKLLKAELYQRSLLSTIDTDEHVVAYRNKDDMTALVRSEVRVSCAVGDEVLALEIWERSRAQALIRDMARRGKRVAASLSAAEMQRFARESGQTFLTIAAIADYDDGKIVQAWIVPDDVRADITFHALLLPNDLASLQLTTAADAAKRRCETQTRDFTRKTIAKGSIVDDATAEKLYVCLWEALEPWLPTSPSSVITICADSELSWIPFAALLSRRKERVIQKHTIVYAPSTTAQLFAYSAWSEVKAHTERECLLVGNPIMPKLAIAEGLEPLPIAEAEIRLASRILGCDKVYLGKDARKDVVLERLRSASVVHLATHGLMLCSPVRKDILGALVLTMVDDDDAESCLLYAEELQRERLDRCELVVLSCCHTGKGALMEEGLMGFGRACLFAGAKAVLLSFWEIKEAAPVLLFFEHFYNAYRAGVGAAAALRAATTLMIERGMPANDWASFYVYGNGM